MRAAAFDRMSDGRVMRTVGRPTRSMISSLALLVALCGVA
jgi:hypothetical protein